MARTPNGDSSTPRFCPHGRHHETPGRHPRPGPPSIGRVDGGGRSARLVLVHDGTVPGALPPVHLDMPWWPEAQDVVAAARERFGVEVVLLRLLEAQSDQSFGGGGHISG